MAIQSATKKLQLWDRQSEFVISYSTLTYLRRIGQALPSFASGYNRASRIVPRDTIPIPLLNPPCPSPNPFPPLSARSDYTSAKPPRHPRAFGMSSISPPSLVPV